MQRHSGPSWGRAPFAAAGLLLAVVGWTAFVVGAPVPLLQGVDLATHEVGHLVFGWGPGWLGALGGPAVQVLVPLVLVASFLGRERDLLAAAICTGWASASIQQVSTQVRQPVADLLGLSAGLALGLAFALTILGPRLQPFVQSGAWPRWPLLPLPVALPEDLAELDRASRDRRLRDAEQRLEREREEAGLPAPASGQPLGTPVPVRAASIPEPAPVTPSAAVAEPLLDVGLVIDLRPAEGVAPPAR